MKKIDKLLKKVELFERLAVYGDRKSFLQSLSQALPRVVVPNEGPPGSGGHFVDPNQVSDVADPVDRDQSILMQKQLNAPAAPEKAAPARQAVVSNPRVLSVQNFLNQQLSQGGLGQASMPPITPDGKYGPETDRALKLWGQKNKLPLNANQLFEMAEVKASAANTVAQLKNTPNLNAQNS